MKSSAVAVFVGVALAVVFAQAACGASTATRSAYMLEVTRCLENEHVILVRSGTTEEQDRADLDAERARCDAARRAIEAQEGTH